MNPKKHIYDYLPGVGPGEGENPLMDLTKYRPDMTIPISLTSYNEAILDMGEDELMGEGGECLCCTNDDGTQCMGHKVYGGCECSYACPECGGEELQGGGGAGDTQEPYEPYEPYAYSQSSGAYGPTYPDVPGPGGYKGPRSPLGTGTGLGTIGVT